MAIESPELADIEAQRAELEAVLHSEPFTRAPTLANLLSYLCESLFAGKASQIKEYSVGVEVFHRGPSFDQDSDSIVRVEANRLRKRLAAYYAGEGASHRLHITIPLGQYIPRFESAVSHQVEPVSTDAAALPPPGIKGAITRLTEPMLRLSGRPAWWLVAALALLSLGLGCALLIVRHIKQAVPAAESNQPALPAEAQLGPPGGEEVRILAGSSRGFVDHAGKLWNADAWFDGGTAVRGPAQQIWRTQNSDFYRHHPAGAVSLRHPTEAGHLRTAPVLC
jgi:hypothetical protein